LVRDRRGAHLVGKRLGQAPIAGVHPGQTAEGAMSAIDGIVRQFADEYWPTEVDTS